MEDIYLELPTKISINNKSFNLFASLDQTLHTLTQRTIKISLKKTKFIHPSFIPILKFFIKLAESKENKVILSEVSISIKKLLESHGILENEPNAKGYPIFESFELSKDERFILYLEESLRGVEQFNELTYIYSYLKFFFRLLNPQLICSVSCNLRSDWLFFSVISSKLPILDDITFHLLIDELKMTGGHLWVVQGKKSFNLKETFILENELKKTLVIIAFPLGTI